MKHGVDSLTGIRPTADLTIANYLGAVQPILQDEAEGRSGAVFLAELHAATTNEPREVLKFSHELTRTLIASGVQGEIYSQKDFADDVAAVEYSIRGLITAARLLRLPTLKEKIKQSDNPENANVSLMMYPVMMASDIILARPESVPTGKDQKPHLEITNELTRLFNSRYNAELPEPTARDQDPINILSLDGSGRKMSKSIPGGAIFLDDAPEVGHKKIMKTRTASEPGPDMDKAVDNLVVIAEGLGGQRFNDEIISLRALSERVKAGEGVAGQFKSGVGDIVADFLQGINAARALVSDQEVRDRIAKGKTNFAPIAHETRGYMEAKQWSSES